jgi:hypothetical protein
MPTVAKLADHGIDANADPVEDGERAIGEDSDPQSSLGQGLLLRQSAVLFDEPHDIAESEPPLAALGAVVAEPTPIRVSANRRRTYAEEPARLFEVEFGIEKSPNQRLPRLLELAAIVVPVTESSKKLKRKWRFFGSDSQTALSSSSTTVGLTGFLVFRGLGALSSVLRNLLLGCFGFDAEPFDVPSLGAAWR